jgi:hypothetical protein
MYKRPITESIINQRERLKSEIKLFSLSIIICSFLGATIL